MTIAFQADLTRVMTFLVTHEGTSRAYREIGIPDGHHPLTHHRNQADLMEKVAQINCYHMQQFAGWVEKLKSIKEGDGTLLDNSMIVYGAGLSDGNRHVARRSSHADRRPRRQDHQDRAAGGLPQGNSDVQSFPRHDGSHGRAHGSFRRFHRQNRRPRLDLERLGQNVHWASACRFLPVEKQEESMNKLALNRGGRLLWASVGDSVGGSRNAAAFAVGYRMQRGRVHHAALGVCGARRCRRCRRAISSIFRPRIPSPRAIRHPPGSVPLALT